MATTNRRNFLRTTIGISAATVASTALGVNPLNTLAGCSSPNSSGDSTDGSGDPIQFSQDPLGYEYNALEPHIDARTMEIHYTKHHTAYITNVNEAIKAEEVTYSTPEELFANISKLSAKIRNNGGGAWNHSFFWKSLRAPVEDGNAPAGELSEAINSAFGSFDQFKEQFAAAGAGRFGSGWAWLVSDNGTLKIGSTPNQDNPLMDDVEIKGKPLLGLDVWEHAYYLHYQNRRPEYITNWWNVVNWDFVAEQFS